MLDSATTFLENNPDDEVDLQEMDQALNSEDEEDDEDVEQADWMQNQNPNQNVIDLVQIDPNQMQGIDPNQYWHADNVHYSQVELDSMGSWLMDKKRAADGRDLYVPGPFDLSKLNSQQKFAYSIVKEHLEKKKQLLMRIEGFAGLGFFHIKQIISIFKKKVLNKLIKLYSF